MTRGGERENSGRKQSTRPTIKKQFIIYEDQVKFLNRLGKYKGSNYVRVAIEEKRIRDYNRALGIKETTDK